MMRDDSYWESLVHELAGLPRETEWLEFKENKADPQEIGEYISALSNAAALDGRARAYLVWGVADDSHALTGTHFDPRDTRVGNEELESWLLRQLSPKIGFRFHRRRIEEMNLVVLEIDSAFRHPVQFAGREYIRIGSYKKLLKDFPERERELWRTLDATPFELVPAAENLPADDVLALLDHGAYFELMQQPLPARRQGVLDALAGDRLITSADGGRWNILHLGAILFARRLSDFGRLHRKAVRVISYKGRGRIETIREHEEARGYASAFTGLIRFINSLLPINEAIGQALRTTVPVFPELATRELVANALIHQDFGVTGAGPMVEVFEDRIEVTNPGKPLIDPQRFLDHPPRSRNESLASLMRRIGVCEERGSGVDKVVFQAELYQLPAPAFEILDDSTRCTIFAPRPLSRMDRDDRIRAVYLHACLRYVQREYMTNTSLRERFGIDQKNSAVASRLLKDALEAGAVRVHDETAGLRLRKYVPSWASVA